MFQARRRQLIMDEPQLINKIRVSQCYPQLVEKWNVQLTQQTFEAQRIEQKFLTFMRRFSNIESSLFTPDPPALGVLYDQQLSSGMRRHWGEVQICITPPADQAPSGVCKDCRVNHQMQRSTSQDRQIVATRGAWVSLCSDCTQQAMQKNGADHRGCICDGQWTCYRAREIELTRLSLIRTEKHEEGRCGRCSKLVEPELCADVCSRCQGVHVYA